MPNVEHRKGLIISTLCNVIVHLEEQEILMGAGHTNPLCLTGWHLIKGLVYMMPHGVMTLVEISIIIMVLMDVLIYQHLKQKSFIISLKKIPLLLYIKSRETSALFCNDEFMTIKSANM